MKKGYYFLYVCLCVAASAILFATLTPRKLLTTVASNPPQPAPAQQPASLSTHSTNIAAAASSRTQHTTPQPSTSTSVSTIAVTVIIEHTPHSVSIARDASVLDAMNALQATGDIAFAGREYPALGFFVESINGKKHGHGYEWFLSLNGKESETGASQTVLHDGDTVEWTYKQ